MERTNSIDKLIDKLSATKVKLGSALLVASFAFNFGIGLSKSVLKPDSREISRYVEQGIKLIQQTYRAQGGNEVLNPIYYVQQH